MIRRQRTPKIIDDGHGWRSDAVAYEKAGHIAQAIRFPRSWSEQDGTSSLELYPSEIITSINPSNCDTLYDYDAEGCGFRYNHVVTDAQCQELGQLIAQDMTPAQRHWLGTPWLNKTGATRTVLTCQRDVQNAPEGLVVYERTMNLSMVDKEFTLDYEMKLHHIYVLSESRGRSIGHALIAPIALDFAGEVRHLARVLDQVRAKRLGHLDISFSLIGDIASAGGRCLYDDLRGSMCADVDLVFTPSQQRKYLISEYVDEETADMYFDPDEAPVERIREIPKMYFKQV